MEIRKRVFDMGPWKSYVWDGYYAGFSLKTWEVNGSDTSKFC